jgi:hypothetical protein
VFLECDLVSTERRAEQVDPAESLKGEIRHVRIYRLAHLDQQHEERVVPTGADPSGQNQNYPAQQLVHFGGGRVPPPRDSAHLESESRRACREMRLDFHTFDKIRPHTHLNRSRSVGRGYDALVN